MNARNGAVHLSAGAHQIRIRWPWFHLGQPQMWLDDQPLPIPTHAAPPVPDPPEEHPCT